ncbi:SMP-30/gluconolactonase/LRE family protein [Cellulomonas sp. URHD0024]|uniref:SMP-30/gluconolactonase/LRE family protein n=1 Tax=Cellulomonas sp. URHD0024 TaxID=1302620 RepID=UPI0004264B8D|nr:SMP-30/gluconolactonase/LRE family protein [Cellulomonas sp. URHD0024]
MTAFTAHPATVGHYVLAEGPVWSAESRALIWVDVERGEVFEGAIAGDEVVERRRLTFDGTVGAAVPGPDGSLLVAAHDRLVVVESDGTRTAGPLVVDDPASRTNDGACDPGGRFLVGTMRYDEVGGGDRLLRIEDDGATLTLDTDLSISNGIAWSPDGSAMYNADTMRGTIWTRRYDAATGTVGERRELVTIDGYPDGICVDAGGNIWVAMWGAGEVHSYSPAGARRDTVRLPAPHVSSVAFAGSALDRLVITTASRDLDDIGRAQFPHAGRIFLADVGVAGAPTHRWSGSWSPYRPQSPL